MTYTLDLNELQPCGNLYLTSTEGKLYKCDFQTGKVCNLLMLCTSSSRTLIVDCASTLVSLITES